MGPPSTVTTGPPFLFVVPSDLGFQSWRENHGKGEVSLQDILTGAQDSDMELLLPRLPSVAPVACS